MSAGNQSFAARHKLIAAYPGLVDGNTLATAWVSLSDSVRVVAGVLVGDTATTVDAKLQQATDTAGTGAKDVTGAAITQLSATDDNKHVTIDCEAAHLDEHNGFTCVRLLITVGSDGSGGNVAGFLLLPTRHAPPTQVAAYAQQVEVAG